MLSRTGNLVDDRARIRRKHPRALAMRDLDQAHPLQVLQRLTNSGTANLEGRHQLTFRR